MGEERGEHGGLLELIAGELTDDAALAHHVGAVGESDDLGQVGRDDQDRGARGGEVLDGEIDLAARADIDAGSSKTWMS